MPRRRAPRTFPQRVAGAIESMIPGTLGGRMSNAGPVVQSNVNAVSLGDVGTTGQGSGISFKHDTFTAVGGAEDLTLTYDPVEDSAHVYLIPSGTDSGDYQSEGTAYTLAGRTLSVLAAMGSAAGDIIDVRYAYLSGSPITPPDPDAPVVRTDTFDRADSATTLNPASDGGTWTAFTYRTGAGLPVMGIKSNQAYAVNAPGTNEFFYTDLGTVGCDMSITDIWTSFSRGQFYFAVDPTAGTGYRMDWDGNLYRWVAVPGSNSTSDTSLGVLGGYFSGDVVRLTYDPATGDVTMYRNGTFVWTITDTSPLTGTGNTCVGFGATQPYYVGGGSSGTVNTGETFDDFSATPA